MHGMLPIALPPPHVLCMRPSWGWQPMGAPKNWSEPVHGPTADGRCYGAYTHEALNLKVCRLLLMLMCAHAGVCDDDIAMCYCNGTYGRVTPAEGSRCAMYESAQWPSITLVGPIIEFMCACNAATRHSTRAGPWACTVSLTRHAPHLFSMLVALGMASHVLIFTTRNLAHSGNHWVAARMTRACRWSGVSRTLKSFSTLRQGGVRQRSQHTGALLPACAGHSPSSLHPWGHMAAIP